MFINRRRWGKFVKSSHCGEDEDDGLEVDNVDNDQDDENGDFEDD